jgi:hypothetical protein
MSLRAIVEEGTNFPRVLGFKSRPLEIVRTTKIGQQAMALIGGETPVHLAQRFFGQSHITGPASSHLPARLTIDMFPQLTNRPKLKDLMKGKRLLSSIAYPAISPVNRNIPAPYERPPSWDRTRQVANLPSAMGIVSGPSRTVHGLAVLI